MVTVDSHELREWADKHADAGNHGVAHVLYKAADGMESVTDQAIREAQAVAWQEGFDRAQEQNTAHIRHYGYRLPTVIIDNPYETPTERHNHDS